jgi:hypothetical protein
MKKEHKETAVSKMTTTNYLNDIETLHFPENFNGQDE